MKKGEQGGGEENEEEDDKEDEEEDDEEEEGERGKTPACNYLRVTHELGGVIIRRAVWVDEIDPKMYQDFTVGRKSWDKL